MLVVVSVSDCGWGGAGDVERRSEVAGDWAGELAPELEGVLLGVECAVGVEGGVGVIGTVKNEGALAPLLGGDEPVGAETVVAAPPLPP